MKRIQLAGALLLLAAPAAQAAETISYSYDARGRLVKVVRTAPSGNATTSYQFDKADNRLNKTVTTP